MTDESQHPKDPWTDKPKKLPKKKQLASKKASFHPLKHWLTTVFNQKNFKNSSKKPSIIQIGLSVGINTLLIWIAFGFFNIAPSEQAVITRFGKYQKTLSSSGFHWRMPLIDRVIKLSAQATTRYLPPIEIITKEGTLISAKVEIRIRISNPYHYLFSSKKPLETLYYLSSKALYETFNEYTTTHCLNNLEEVEMQMQAKLNSLLHTQMLGLHLIKFTVRAFEFPKAVQTSFDAIKKTQTDLKKLQQQLEEEASLAKQNAAVQVETILAEATAYQHNTLSEARKDYDRFLNLLPQYKKSPKSTLHKLYLEALESILKHNPKIIMWNEESISTQKKDTPQMNLSLDGLFKAYSIAKNSSEATTIHLPSDTSSDNKTISPKDSTLSWDSLEEDSLLLGGYD